MNSNIEKIKDKLVRKYIRQHLIKEDAKTQKNIKTLRKIVSTILENAQFHDSTGLNTLEALLLQLLTKKPSEGGEIGTTYKSLTTSPSQRRSYRKHLMLWIKQLIENHFSEQEMMAKVESSIENDDKYSIIDEEDVNPLAEGAWKIVFNDEEGLESARPEDAKNHYTFSDLDQEVQDLDSFTKLEGEDQTGMSTAERVFGRIRKPIIDALSKLADELDQKVFSLFLLKNLDTRFNEWEEQIASKR